MSLLEQMRVGGMLPLTPALAMAGVGSGDDVLRAGGGNGGGWNSSSQFLSSAGALQRLCETSPDHPVSDGFLKTAGGGGLGAGTAWLGSVAHDMWPMMFHNSTTAGTAMDVAATIVWGALLLGLAAGSLYFLADGASSIVKPLRSDDSSDRTVHYHNGGFTRFPTLSDRWFGSPVFPSETVDGLEKVTKGYALLNGVIVDEEPVLKKKTSMVTVNTGKTITVVPQTNYNVTLRGMFHGRPINAFTDTIDGHFAKTLAALERGAAIYLLGSPGDSGLEARQFGDALTR